MATSNGPRHDFAPAWLKIPSQDNLKSAAGCKQSGGPNEKAGRLKKEDSASIITGNNHSPHNNSSSSSSSRYNSDYSKLHRQHSFENYQDNKRYLSSQPKYRHHSVDDDYYSYPYGHYTNYYNGYNAGYEKYSMQYGSQPSLLRPPSRQESGKYQHPNSRFTGPAGYNNYYDVYQQDYHHADPYYNPYPTNRQPPGNARKNLYERDSRVGNPKNEGIGSSNKDNRDYVDRSNNKDMSNKDRNVFNDEFPMLNGRDEVYNQSNYISTNGNSVWDNPLPSKSGNYLSKNEINFGDYQGPRDNDRSRIGNGTYRVMTPNKSSSPCPTDNRNNPKASNQTENSTEREMLKDSADLSLEDNGSQRRLSSGKLGNHSYGCNSPEELVNGVDHLSLKDNNQPFLSSSLEAEQRLLRQMGWTESEDDEYVITEDDKKEFQKLTNQAKEQQRNGLVRPLPKTWSPKHIPVYQPNTQELNEASSSDSDSEDSC